MAEKTGVRFETVFRDNKPPQDALISQLINWGQRFHRLGIATGSAGNLSFRTRQGFIITGTGISLADLQPEEFVEVTRQDREPDHILIYARGAVIPSKESIFHWEIYQLRAETNAILHAHDQLVLEFAEELGVPCTEQEQPRGSYEQTVEISRLLRLTEGARYITLRNHGIISLGATVEEAGRQAEDMNRRARRIAQQRRNKP